MHVYFVRHGETELNRAHIHQSPNTPLSAEGRVVVESVAESLRGMNPDLLITSGYTRARESAEIIGAQIGLTPYVHEAFYEIVRPSSFHGKSIFTLETVWFVFLSTLNRYRTTWRYKDAENVSDISERAKKALKFIESHYGSNESVVVVSHSVFINVMIAYMCKNRMLDVRDMLGMFLRSKRMKNGDITHVECLGKNSENVCNWEMKGPIRTNV